MVTGTMKAFVVEDAEDGSSRRRLTMDRLWTKKYFSGLWLNLQLKFIFIIPFIADSFEVGDIRILNNN